MKSRMWTALILLAMADPLPTQTQPQTVSIGYRPPGNLSAAAGGVLTLFVPDLNVPDAVAPGTPWPSQLSGVAVAVRALAECGTSGYPASLPIYRVYSQKTCHVGDLVCPNTQITVQIPFETVCNDNVVQYPQIALNVKANNLTGPDVSLSVGGLLPHILNSCDAIFGPSKADSCHALITHADGTAVNGLGTVRVGETLVLYAVGLGGAAGPTKTGYAFSSNFPLGPNGGFPLSWNFRLELPSVAYIPVIQTDEKYAGTVSGYVGLYQLNFVVPALPPQAHQCTPGGSDANAQLSFDTVPSLAEAVLLCVQP